MKRLTALILLICLCVGLCACGSEPKTTEPQKSANAQKADELILAIGEVTADSEAAITGAQAFYDSLTDEEKAEVEHYDLLLQAQDLLPEKKAEAQLQQIRDLIAQGDYIQASDILYANPELPDFDKLTKECGKGVIPQYIKSNGEEKEAGKYFLNLVNEDGVQISVWYFGDTGAIQFLYYETGYGTADAIVMDHTLGGSEMAFARSTMSMGSPVNYQEGVINTAEYAGTYSGSLAENSADVLVIPGLTVTVVQTVYETQTRGYQVATMGYINDMLDAMYTALTEVGYKGSMNDLGFTAYKGE